MVLMHAAVALPLKKTSQITDILVVSIQYIFSREGRGIPEAEVNDAR